MGGLSPEQIANAVLVALLVLGGLAGRLTLRGRSRAREMTRLRIRADEAEQALFDLRKRMRDAGYDPGPLPPSVLRAAEEKSGSTEPQEGT
ncbi:MAG: hypothetical protein IE926_01950 [Micrococcales bacterium]|nr:hypothetical protein [Micrococcales bacterium]